MKEEKFYTLGSPFTGGDRVWWGGSFGAMEENAATGMAEGKVGRFLHRVLVPTSTHQPEKLVCSPTRADGGLGAEALATEVRSQEEDWGWLCEHSLRGLVSHS